MRGARLLFACALALCLATSAAAQDQPRAETARVYFVTPKAGMEMQFEDAVRKHTEWHRQKNDPWRWDARFTETGSRTGEYLMISTGHQWKDLDNPPVPEMDDAKHWFSTASQFVASSSSIILRTRPDISRSAPGTPLPPIAIVTYYHLKYGQTGKFVEAQRQIREALDKTDAPIRSTWFQLVASSVNSVFVQSSPRDNWAAFELGPGPTVAERVEQIFGRTRADAIFKALEESVQYTETKITSARPDLSYVPPSSP